MGRTAHEHAYSPHDWVNNTMECMYPGRAPRLRELGLRPIQDTIAYELPVVGLIGHPDWHNATHVAASPCIGHCAGEISGLTVSVAADLLMGLRVAERTRLPLLSYVASGEETFLVPGGTRHAHAWAEVADYVADLAASWAGDRVEASQVRTHQPKVWRLLQDQVAADRPALPDPDLDGLHRLADDLPYPRNTRFTYLYSQYRSNIAHYRKSVIEELLGERVGHLLVVENVQQIKYVRHVARLNSKRLPVSHLVTCPAPDRTSTIRVSRAEPHNRITLTEFLKVGVMTTRPFWELLSELRCQFDLMP